MLDEAGESWPIASEVPPEAMRLPLRKRTGEGTKPILRRGSTGGVAPSVLEERFRGGVVLAERPRDPFAGHLSPVGVEPGQ